VPTFFSSAGLLRGDNQIPVICSRLLRSALLVGEFVGGA
jgi:hypothetical protein